MMMSALLMRMVAVPEGSAMDIYYLIKEIVSCNIDEEIFLVTYLRGARMSLSRHRNELKKLYAARIAHASSDPRQVLFCRSLRYLIDHAEEFDACVPEDNPFYREFTALLTTGFGSEEDCFSLFECVVIFFRLRQCAGGMDAPSPVERDVLRHFEQCGEWLPEDATLVCEWYWRRIPALAVEQAPAAG